MKSDFPGYDVIPVEPAVAVPLAAPVAARKWRPRASAAEIRIEAVRKAIHLVIGFVPLLAAWNRSLTLALLAAGTLAYAGFETLRRRGVSIPVVSVLTRIAARRRDTGKFVRGPVTLGAGAFLAVALFPEPASAIAILTLALGDSVSSFVGKTVGRIPMPLTRGKSVEGSVSCFAVSFAAAWALTGRALPSALVALVSTFVEAMPLKDWDNIVLPLCAGFAALMLF